MAWIQYIDEADADEKLAEFYASMLDPDAGKVDHVLKIHGLHPAGLASHFQLYRSSMASTARLRKVDREMIAVVVSQRNSCHY